MFEKLFQLRYRIKITSVKERLNRECSLFTDNGFALVVSATQMSNNQRSKSYDLYTNNKAYKPLFLLENYTIYLLNLNCGAICHSIHLKCDKIYLDNNQDIF